MTRNIHIRQQSGACLRGFLRGSQHFIPRAVCVRVKDIPDAERGFRLLFSTGPIPGYADKLTWRRGDSSGNWYYSEQLQKEGWLCPGLFKYYRSAPREIYAKAERK